MTYTPEPFSEEPDQGQMFARNVFVITMIGAVVFIASCLTVMI